MLGELLGFAGSALGSLMGWAGQRDANRRNERLYFENRDWETQMSSTAVQRRAADIRRAGGNPALAFTSGQEASSPTSGTPMMQNENAQGADIIANIGPKIMAAKLARQQLLQASAQTHLTTEQARMVADQAANVRADTLLKLNTGGKVQAETDEIRQRIGKLAVELDGIISDNEIKAVQAYIASHTMTEAISAIRSDAILKHLSIPKKELEGTWAKAKTMILDILTSPQKD